MFFSLRIQTDVPLKIRNLQVIITDGSNNYKLLASQYLKFTDLLSLRKHHATSSNCSESPTQSSEPQQFESSLKLEPYIYYQFSFLTEAQQFLENTQLRVLRVEASMGSDKIFMQLIKSRLYMRSAFRYHNRQHDLDDNITINPICYIAPT